MLADLPAHFARGDAVQARVISVAPLRLSLRPEGAPPATAEAQAAAADAAARQAAAAAAAGTTGGGGKRPPAGAVLALRVVRKVAGQGLELQIEGEGGEGAGAGAARARAHITELCDEWVDSPLAAFAPNNLVEGVVLGPDPRGKGVHVSLRAAAKAAGGKAIGGKKAAAATAAAVRPRQVFDLVVGELVRGYVKAISARGCFVSLSHTLDGFVGLKHISDDFIKVEQLPSLVSVGQLVVAPPEP